MITTDEAALRILNALLRAGRDAERGYLMAGDLTADPELVQLFAANALQRAKFGQEIEERIRALRSTPQKTDGTLAGDLHRGWMGLQAITADNGSHALLSACETGEGLAVAAYREALKDNDLDGQTRVIVQKQYELVQLAHDRIRQLRDRAAG